MKTPPSTPSYRAGTQVGNYIEACHVRIWSLLDIVSPKPEERDGDCLVEADKVIERKRRR